MSGTTSRPAGILVLAAVVGLVAAVATPRAEELPRGYLGEVESQAILDKTLRIYLQPDLSELSDGERRALGSFLEAGKRIQELYEESRHYQARAAYEELQRLHRRRPSAATRNLLDLYRLYSGPVGTMLDGKVRPFLPVEERARGGTLYPWGVAREEIDRYLKYDPGARSEILGLRTAVRRATRRNVSRDMDALEMNEALLWLHPGLREELRAVRDRDFYAVPYAVAFAEPLLEIAEHLRDAAAAVDSIDVDMAAYLRHRAVDLLRNDYEAGDAAWVTGRFAHMNVQVGAYETYDDDLYGVKSYFGMSILVRDPVMTSSLETVTQWMQEFEDLLPHDTKKRVRSDIPVGVYNVVADFGQARGTNTATILPNESQITRKYGRSILIRRNILENAELFATRRAAFEAAIREEFHGDYAAGGDFFRTLFHEIGHYLGPDTDKGGRSLDLALQEDASIIEELKADLISLFLAKRLNKKGYYTRDRLRAVQSAGIRRTLRKSEPRKTQVYATMELMQMNYYLKKGLLEFDAESGKLVIHYDRYYPVVEEMLREVLALQYAGDKAAADEFIDEYSTWDGGLHQRIADAMKANEPYRFALVRYAALDG